MPADPSLQSVDRDSRFRQLEVFPPASHVPSPFVAQLVTAAAPPTVPHLPYLRFEWPSLSRSWRRSPAIADASRSNSVSRMVLLKPSAARTPDFTRAASALSSPS